MSLINDIKKDIMTIISGSSLVQDVSDFPKTNFKGFPAVVVLWAGLTNEIATNVENERIVTFKIIILDQVGRDTDSDDSNLRAEKNINNIISDLIDRFDDTYNLSGSTSVDFSMPVNTDEPVFAELSSGWARKVEMLLTFHKRFIT